ncbi:MAG: hypothetical protein Q7P63_14795 [Verrucomicrobiota bacterium JB022]|nr:hypothetical protein [Verrucomicrobiota bacterium JB022]
MQYSRYITQVATRALDPAQEDAGLAALRLEVGKREARRMSGLGMLLHRVMEGIDIGQHPRVIYTTTYTESRFIERFLESFPQPSPMMFQSSIHPGGVEQVLIQRQQAVRDFIPLAGQEGLIASALDHALLPDGVPVLWLGGEERATWLTELELASDHSFAYALALSDKPEGALGEIRWERESETTDTQLLLHPAWFQALAARESGVWNLPEGGTLHLQWHTR